MRHLKKGRKLSRRKDSREALITNLAKSLISYGKIKTTEAKAKELIAVVENLISLGLKGDLASRRRILAVLSSKKLTSKLINEVKEKYQNRKSGHLRIYKLGPRKGDKAPLVQVEFS